jgi:hypothetical protein
MNQGGDRTLSRDITAGEGGCSVCAEDCMFLLKLATHLNQLAFAIPDPTTNETVDALLNIGMTLKTNVQLSAKGYARFVFMREYGYRPTDNDPVFLVILSSLNVPV